MRVTIDLQLTTSPVHKRVSMSFEGNIDSVVCFKVIEKHFHLLAINV